MISVETRDGRKGQGLGFGVGREMDETELEEGEACCYPDDDTSIDPDVALSYIDEKLQDVLGHFQKDFEGGVSAENLGAKFGGYGSFLPTYQRSPTWSHRTPPKAQNNGTPRSPNSFHLEACRSNTTISSSAPLAVRHGAVLKAPSIHDTVKQDISMSATRTEEPTLRSDLVNKSSNRFDQKTLKVRIKMGSDNLSTRKNAEIYSGLGLDVSPCSSLDGSPTDSEGLSHEPQDTPHESPASILQIMTSFPVKKGQLLSPLQDVLIQLTEKEKVLGENTSSHLLKGGQESSFGLANWKVLGEKKTKTSKEKNGYSAEAKRNINGKNSTDGTVGRLNKDMDIDATACEELVSNALKLPLLSNLYCSLGDTAKIVTVKASDTSKELNKVDKFFPDQEEHFKAISAGKIFEDQKSNAQNDVSVYPKKDGSRKGETTCDSVKTESNTKPKKSQIAQLMDPPKQKITPKMISHEQGTVQLPREKEIPILGGKKKSKGTQSNGNLVVEVLKESSKVDSSMLHKNKKSSSAEKYSVKTDIEEAKVQKDTLKVRETYRDLFGDLKEENEMDLFENKEGVMDSETVDCTYARTSEAVDTYTSKDNRMSSKKIDKPLTTEAQTNGALNAGSNAGVTISTSQAGPVVIKENWVCCDKCQKWRLLPHGTNPDVLPQKWLCSMLNWLPGMNRCSISEKETTRALSELNQVPAPDRQNNLQSHPEGGLSGVIKAEKNHQDLSFNASSGGNKKKNLTNATYLQGPIHMKKNPQATKEVNEFDLDLEKQRNKQKENSKPFDHFSDGGDNKLSKMKIKREGDQDSFKASKKVKTDGARCSNEDWACDHAGSIKKVGPSPSNYLSKNNRSTSKESPQVSVKKPQDNEGSLGVSKKRKSKEETSENESRKEKKPRISNSSLDGNESMKRDVSLRPSAAATSSSSKVSGSRKTKPNLQELKSSPVESVSSSPLRVLNSFGRSLDFHDGEEDGGSDRSGTVKKESISDFQDRGYSKLPNRQLVNVGADNPSEGARYLGEPRGYDRCHEGEREKDSHYHSNGSRPKKSGKGSSSRSKEKNRNLKSEFDKGKIKVSESHEKIQDCAPSSHDEKQREGKKQVKEKTSGVKSDKVDNNYVGSKDEGKFSGESSKRENARSITPKQEVIVDSDAEKSAKRFFSGKTTDRTENVPGRGKPLPLPPSGGTQNEKINRFPRPIPENQKGNGANDGTDIVDALKAPKKNVKKAENQNGSQNVNMRHPTPSGHRVDSASPARRDYSSNQAANNALKEATDLKHMADRLKNSGSNLESTVLYFQAALKFLHGASLLESSSSESSQHGESKSMQIYSSTAKLCEFCAHEYERLKDMGSAALAYKCMEVAYMRVIYFSNTSASRDRHELQSALQMVPPGESPSSSASDVDNLNNPAAVEKVALSTKCVSSPQVGSNHVIAARSRPNFVRLLNFARDVNYAMDASRRSRTAFAAANVSLEEARHREGLSSIKTALDFNFQDVEGLLRLVRLAMNEISR